MSAFRAQITDAFVINDNGVALTLTNVVGEPTSGLSVCVGEWSGRIIDVGRNSTDGQVISTRSCLTGQEVAPYGAVVVAGDCPIPAHGAWISEDLTE